MPLLPEDETRICPFDKTHEILVERWGRHIFRCAKNHPNAPVAICRFDAHHIVSKEEIVSHERNCNKNFNPPHEYVEVTWEAPDPNRNSAAVFVSENDPAWSEECQTYNPQAVSLEKDILRLKQCVPKGERRLHRRQEAERIAELKAREMDTTDINESGTLDMSSSRQEELQLRRPTMENPTASKASKFAELLKNRPQNGQVQKTEESAYDKYVREEMEKRM